MRRFLRFDRHFVEDLRGNLGALGLKVLASRGGGQPKSVFFLYYMCCVSLFHRQRSS